MKDGKIISCMGDAVDSLPAKPAFASSYFEKVDSKDGRFSATVVDPEAFFGVGIGARGMKVDILYNASAIQSITLHCQTENHAQVVATYPFD